VSPPVFFVPEAPGGYAGDPAAGGRVNPPPRHGGVLRHGYTGHTQVSLEAGERVTLSGAEGRHAATVQRLRPGERVDLTDGAGLLAECLVVAAGGDELELEVRTRRREPPAHPRLVVVQALPKGDRGELAVEMMTEAGVDAIVPWAAARCVTRWRGERGARALRRWRNAARAAVKQSRGRWLPEVTEQVTTAQAVELARAAGLALVLDETAATPLSALDLPSQVGAGDPAGERPRAARDDREAPGAAGEPGTIVVVVGPEGGLTGDELAAFAGAGGVAVRLGSTVLRTSTAGLAAAAVLFSRCGRW
jgi:16S rRNA (uracil1498-N3)-methyltransferase